MGNRRSIFLYPFSIIWRIITGFRNFLYDKKILHSHKFDIPLICVGNITVGGTGKTPHAAYIIGLLKDKYNVALLSRGYKRRTRGFRIATPRTVTSDIGDEPFQISRKFPDITVAVDSDRTRGIKKILELKPSTDVIILDDGYQHRRITPGLSLLLSDYERPMSRDHLLPFGDLRESIRNVDRADIMIITKTPENIPVENQKIAEAETGIPAEKKLFYSDFIYLDPVPLSDKASQPGHLPSDPECGILLITGVASPEPLYRHLLRYYKKIIHLSFSDHHYFTMKDIRKIQDAWDKLGTERKYIITTEKDAVRIRELTFFPETLLSSTYYIPVEVNFLNNKKEEFDNLIIEYVRKNKRNN